MNLSLYPLPMAWAWRNLRREWRAGEMRMLALALVVAVGSVTAVGFFTDRIRLAMERQAAELLAADRVVESGRGIDPGWVSKAQELELANAATLAFRSVVVANGKFQLVEVNAVDSAYPLRGTVRVAEMLFGPDRPAPGGPPVGEAWPEARLLQTLGLKPGETLSLGQAALKITAVLTYEPDRAGALFNIAPRLMINAADVPATGLVQTGSLVTYKLGLAGPEDTLKVFGRWVEPRLQPGERFIGGRAARPELSIALDRAERFLGLAALVSVLLAGVAAATASYRHAQRHLDTGAVLRCLGASQRFVGSAYALQVILLGLIASAIGCLVGYLAQGGLAWLLEGFFAQSLPPPSALPAFKGVLTGMVTLAGFSLPPLLALSNVPPLRVLRRELGNIRPGGAAAYTAALVAFGALMIWQAADLTLALYVLVGTVVTLVVLGLFAAALVAAVSWLHGSAGATWRFGLANISRRAGASILQVIAFGVGIMVLLLLSLVRTDLLNSWRDSLPADAPNFFLINIQPEQVAAVRDFIAAERGSEPTLYPMIRGRLVAINDKPVSSADYEEPRAKRLIEREFNLSWAVELAPDNSVVAGRWWGEQGAGRAQWSVEQGLAETLGIAKGDRLRFQIAGREQEGEVTSLRTVEWDSFRVNFFVVAPPGVLESDPASYITSFYVAPGKRELLARLVGHFPNVTVIDVDAVMSRVRSIIERVTRAVEFVFGFTLLAGFTVLAAAIQATQHERRREAAILRTLGASRDQVRAGLVAEFTALGLLAGLVAGFAATLLGYVVAEHLFNLPYRFNPWIAVVGIVGGTFGVGIAGMVGTRRVLRQPPLATLSEA